MASELPAFTEVLSDDQGVCGHTFRTGNSAALARAIVASLEEARDLRLRRGRRLAASYDWSVIGPQVLAMYELAADNRFHAVDAAKGRARRVIA